jgi:hypothetical protein
VVVKSLAQKKNKLPSIILVGLLLCVMAFPLYEYYTVPSKDSWREAQELTKDGRVIVIPAFNVIPYSYYSHKNETGVTYYRDLPDLDEYDYVIIGPAGGYDPDLWEWVNGLEGHRNVTGIQIRRLR